MSPQENAADHELFEGAEHRHFDVHLSDIHDRFHQLTEQDVEACGQGIRIKVGVTCL